MHLKGYIIQFYKWFIHLYKPYHINGLETEKMQNKTVLTRIKPCQYSLSARPKVIREKTKRKKQWKWIKNSKRSMWFFNVIANYDKQMV